MTAVTHSNIQPGCGRISEVTEDEIAHILDSEVYWDRDRRDIDYGDAVKRILALAQARQEPVAWRWCERPHDVWRVTEVKPFPKAGRLIEPLYASPSTEGK